MGDTLYLDTEYEGHGGGRLISLAFAALDGRHWYGVWNAVFNVTDPWVKANVVPYVGAYTKGAVNIRPGGYFDMHELGASLHEYLRSRAPCTIYADWPDDFAHLMRLMSGPSYESSWLIPCTMVLLSESEPKPEVPHNALSDAIALMEWHREKTGHITEDRRHG